MTSPREQAIEAAAKVMCESGGFNPDEIMANDGPRWRCYVPGATAAIDAYESARARLDGAKMVPKEATTEQLIEINEPYDTGKVETYRRRFRAMHDATPKDGERG